MRLRIWGALGAVIALAACGSKTVSSGSSSSSSATSGSGAAAGAGGGAIVVGAGGSTATTTSTGTGGCGPDGPSPDEMLPDVSDPEKGDFTIDEALAGLPEGPGPLRAIVATDVGTLSCELYPDKAPKAVANFVGLARGRRAWKDPKTNKWVKRRFYDGLLFHRVIPDFVAQGGDPLGTGYGGPGYKFADEISDLKHVAGTLAYANSGANTNGSQFYIAEKALPNLDGGYTVFGLCTPVSVVTALTHVPRNAADRPLTDLHMSSITITRCAP
jgi:peptidyl-prolyl cis-trans isomerase A (cyclophilin A)